jgi:hypothetical protein
MTGDDETGRRIPEIQITRKSDERSFVVGGSINSPKYNQAYDKK